MKTPRFRDISGQRFGRLIALRRVGSDSRRQSIWECQCDCGNISSTKLHCLTDGHTQSCGCLHKSSGGMASSRKGAKRSPEYATWARMISRCENPKVKSYPNYGGRGISVCSAWRHDFLQFYEDVGPRPSDKHSIDRIDVNGNYEPGNVRWATATEQVNNRRKFRRCSWREAAKHAYRTVRDFEEVLADYTGAPHVVVVESCTSALLLVCAYLKVKQVELPARTYVGVPQSVVHAGGSIVFRDYEWKGMYQLKPYPIYDSARWFTSGMYIPGSYMCLSFHWTKQLPVGRGGAILCDSKKAADWLRRARFDGRKEGVNPKNDMGLIMGWHCYMPPPLASQGLLLMAGIAEHNEPLPNDDYPYLPDLPVFKGV